MFNSIEDLIIADLEENFNVMCDKKNRIISRDYGEIGRAEVDMDSVIGLVYSITKSYRNTEKRRAKILEHLHNSFVKDIEQGI